MNKNVSSVITKNLTWQILTKNLVTFKRWDGVKNEKDFQAGGSQFASLRVGLAKKSGYVSEEWSIKAHNDVDGFANKPVVQCDV